MAYNPHANSNEDRFPSGIVFFGASSSEPMLDSSSAFIIDEENNSLAIADGYYLGSQSYRQLLHLASDGIATFASGVVIDGNLTVNGDVVTVNTEQILVEDNILTLNSGDYTTPTVDAGIEIFRGTGNVMNLIWNETSDKWTFTDTAGTYDLVGAYLSQELRNKTLDGTYNTFSNIPNSALPNNGSSTVTAGTGLSNGGSFVVGGSVTVDLDLHSLSAGAIANGDSIAFIDANDNATKKESIADIAALFAGNGLTATNSVINVVGGTGITASADSLDIDETLITDQPLNSMSIQNDYMLFYDANNEELAKITVQNLAENIAYSISGESITSFTLGDSFGNVATIIDGSAAIFTEVPSGIETRVAADGKVSIGINLVSNSGLSFQGGELRVDESLISSREALSSAPDAANDYLLIYDSSATALRKINRNNFVSGLGTMSSFTLAGDTGTNQTISNGNTVTIAGGTGLSSVGSNTDTVTINVKYDDSTIGVNGSDQLYIKDAGLNSIAGLTTSANQMIYTTASDTYDVTSLTSFGRSLLDDVDASAARTTLGVDPAGTDNSTNVTLAGSYDYITIVGQVITRNAIDLATDVTGTLPVSNGGTGATSLDDIISGNNKLTVANGTDTVIGGNVTLTVNEGNIVHDNLSGFVANEHINHTSVSINAGTGLSGGGTIAETRTINIANGGVDTTQLADGSVTEDKRGRTVGTIAITDQSASNDINLMNSTSAIGVILPSASTAGTGHRVTVKNINTGAVTITSANGSIDGSSSKVLYYQYESMTFISNGSNWFAI